MGTSFEKQIRTLLDGYQEQPPQHCWDSLSGQLDALHGAQAAGTGAQGAAKAGRTMLRQALSRTAARIVIGAAAAGGIGVGGYLLLRQPAGSQPEAVISATLPDTGAATIPQYIEAAENNAPERVADNTTFHEGVPYHLLTEQAAGSPTAENSILGQTADATAATPALQPQQPAEETRTEMVTKHAGTAPTPKVTEKQEAAADEEPRPEQPELHIPNVISPNGDNINDYFVIGNIALTTRNQLTIYTRNGKVVYDRKDYDNSWNAENLPAGTYLYWFSFEYAGHEFMRQGSVTVIR
ncbi:MAG: gliding motility-associated C-terminal domain-containing protein [Bacteroidales bacterium]|nr:gliding motility-associated C-terminal domain-containing protein [Bacteroidales bacterium]